MKVLIDESAPKALKVALAASAFDCTTVQEAGWSGKENGELLVLADASFDVVVTIDRNLRYQQNLTGRKIALLIVRARSNRVVDLEPHFPACMEALRTIHRARWSTWGHRRSRLFGKEAVEDLFEMAPTEVLGENCNLVLIPPDLGKSDHVE